VEAVSPELALVDPELRVRDLAHHRYQSPPPPPASRPKTRPEPTFTARAVVVLLLVAGAGMLAAWKITAPNAPTSPVRATAAKVAVDRRAAALQRRVLATVMASPASRLPSRLIDPHTGLPRTSMQAACAREETGYRCLVRPYPAKPGEGLVVNYRPGRDGGTFSWGRYQAG